MALRERVALDALQDACEWIESGGEVAVNCGHDKSSYQVWLVTIPKLWRIIQLGI